MRFYGGDPMMWLRKIPVVLVDAHRVMLPRLRAQESLRAITVGLLGSGRVEKTAHGTAIDQLHAEAHGAPARTRKRVKASPAALAAMGIQVVVGNG